MTHAEQTAAGLATWILGRIAVGQLNPADLERTLLAALRDAEEQGAQLASLEVPPDPAPEQARPLNAHVGRRIPISALAAAEWAERENEPRPLEQLLVARLKEAA